MMFNRKQLCQISGVHLEQFKTTTRRIEEGQLSLARTFAPALGQALGQNIDADASVRRWNESQSKYAKYSEIDVLRYAIAVELNKKGGYLEKGLSFIEAWSIARNAIFESLYDHLDRGQKFFVGYVNCFAPGDGGRNVFGSWEDVKQQIGDLPITRIILVEASEIIRIMKIRAKTDDIDVSEMFPAVPALA